LFDRSTSFETLFHGSFTSVQVRIDLLFREKRIEEEEEEEEKKETENDDGVLKKKQ
jgi:hypothetical protein